MNFTPDQDQGKCGTKSGIKSFLPETKSTVWAGKIVKKWRGVQSNPSAALGKYKKGKRIFAVRSGNRNLYPAFQFAENAELLPVVLKILKIVPKEAQGWPLLSWFEARNAFLKNRKPSEVLASESAEGCGEVLLA
jgi:hypothetical protein